MTKYLDALPEKCKNKEQGVTRAVIIEDMIKHGTMFAELEYNKGKTDIYVLDSFSDVLESLYRHENSGIIMWNKTLERSAAVFNFNDKNEKVMMLFPMCTPGFKQGFLENVIAVKGGGGMAKICPITKDYVLYLDCKECENRSDCEAR